MNNEIFETYDDGYYHVGKDIEMYPDAWCIIVWSRRGPGKTYSCLWNAYWKHIPIIYMKRTIDDVNLICTGDIDGFDASPYVPINRDKNTHIIAGKLKDGVGGFWDSDPDGNKDGLPIAYALSLNGIKKIKGFDLSRCSWLVMDEFIPQVGEIVRHSEGAMLLDVYMTVNRDREKRGLPPLKLILFANAEEISTPITNELDVVDAMVDLQASGDSHMYLDSRGILLHHITDEEIPIKDEEKNGIYKAMQGTKWADKAFGGSFANNDFSCVKRMKLKGMKPYIHLHEKTKDYYIYISRDGMYYMCDSRQECIFEYDLTREPDQKRFFIEHGIDLRAECIDDNFRFLKYSMYDLIMNYKKFYKV